MVFCFWLLVINYNCLCIELFVNLVDKKFLFFCGFFYYLLDVNLRVFNYIYVVIIIKFIYILIDLIN